MWNRWYKKNFFGGSQ